MADSKITALTAISTVDPTADPLVIVDVSDTSMAASGTTKKSTINQLLGSGGTATLASATITGAATVGTTLGVTGVSTFAAGSASTPALNTTGDTNTGVYFPASDTVAISTGGSERCRVDSSGNLLVARTGAGLNNTSGVTFGQASIGMQSEGNQIQIVVNRTTSDGTIVDLRRNNSSVGNISVTTSGATFNSTSDYRLKESVAPLSGGLARVNALKPSVYKWKSNGSAGEGFLAHELAEVVPAAVNGEKDDVNEDGSIKAQSIDMSRVVPILVAAIKELTARVQTLEAR